MRQSKKNKKQHFTIIDLALMNNVFNNIKKDTKCNEIRVFEEDKLTCVEPTKILEKVTKQIYDAFGTIKIVELLGSHVFDYYFKNKKSKALKNREIESIDVSNNFIRFNLKKEE